VVLAVVAARTNDGVVLEEDDGNVHWTYYYDEIRLVIERFIGPVPLGAERVVLWPTHCQATRAGMPSTLQNSICTRRQPYNTLDVGEHAIIFAQGMPGGLVPPRVWFKLDVALDSTVDLGQVGEDAPAATVADVIARIISYMQ